MEGASTEVCPLHIPMRIPERGERGQDVENSAEQGGKVDRNWG